MQVRAGPFTVLLTFEWGQGAKTCPAHRILHSIYAARPLPHHCGIVLGRRDMKIGEVNNDEMAESTYPWSSPLVFTPARSGG